MKRILYISPGIEVKGGVSTVVKNCLSSSLSKNHIIFLIASHIDGPKWIKLFQAIIGILKTLYALTFKNIDIVHLHIGNIVSFKRKFYYLQVIKRFNSKVILHLHGGSLIDQFEIASAKWKNRISNTLSSVDFVICLSKKLKTQIIEIAIKANVEIIPNGVIIPAKLLKKKERFIRITFLGHIIDEKGIFDLLKIFAQLLNDGFNVKLSIGGIGEDQRLIQEIKEYKIVDNVEFLGWVSEKKRDKLLRNTDIYVLPSYTEALPMSIIEAMAYSIPVISTTVGGIPELICEGKTGYLLSPGDNTALYKKISLLIRNCNLRHELGRRARYIAKTNHNINSISEKISDIYRFL